MACPAPQGVFFEPPMRAWLRALLPHRCSKDKTFPMPRHAHYFTFATVRRSHLFWVKASLVVCANMWAYSH
jgi:hypothetical protein